MPKNLPKTPKMEEILLRIKKVLSKIEALRNEQRYLEANGRLEEAFSRHRGAEFGGQEFRRLDAQYKKLWRAERRKNKKPI